MPVTKTAKRAQRSSKRKGEVNKLIISKLEIAIRKAKKTKSQKDILEAISQADKSMKKRVIHKNKAARIKSSLSKLLPKPAKSVKKPVRKISAKKTSGRALKSKSAKA